MANVVSRIGLVFSVLVGLAAPFLEVLPEGTVPDGAPWYVVSGLSLLGILGAGVRYAINQWRDQRKEDRLQSAAEAKTEREHQMAMKKLEIEQQDRENDSRIEVQKEIFSILRDIKTDLATLKERNHKIDGAE